jgi:hypothetical protein
MIEEVLLEMVEPETAGDPMSAPKWVRSSLRSLSTRLHHAGHAASAPTVWRLLKKHADALARGVSRGDASADLG